MEHFLQGNIQKASAKFKNPVYALMEDLPSMK